MEQDLKNVHNFDLPNASVEGILLLPNLISK
jgi:hypothetical protein